MSDQGDAIRIVMERRKRQRRSKVILGGTPSVAGLSRVEEFIALSDRRVLPTAAMTGAAHGNIRCWELRPFILQSNATHRDHWYD